MDKVLITDTAGVKSNDSSNSKSSTVLAVLTKIVAVQVQVERVVLKVVCAAPTRGGQWISHL